MIDISKFPDQMGLVGKKHAHPITEFKTRASFDGNQSDATKSQPMRQSFTVSPKNDKEHIPFGSANNGKLGSPPQVNMNVNVSAIFNSTMMPSREPVEAKTVSFVASQHDLAQISKSICPLLNIAVERISQNYRLDREFSREITNYFR